MKMRKIFGIALIACAGIFAAGCRQGGQMAEEKPRDYFSEVKSVNKLVLAQMTITKMATIDDIDLEKAKGMKQIAAGVLDAIKPGSRKAAYSYDTYLRAYLDMSTLAPEDVKVDDATRTITLTLPAVQTEFAGRDMEIREDHYRVTGLRSHIDPKERAAVKEQMNTSLKNEVEKNPAFRDRLTSDARTKAEAYFKSLLGSDGYNVIVNFK